MDFQKLSKRKIKALKEKDDIALCLACSDLADFHMKEESFNEAIDEYKELAKMYKKGNKLLEFATVNRGMGEAYMLLTDYERAIEHQRIYLAISRQQGNQLEEQRALAALGHTHLTKHIGGKKDKNDLTFAYKYLMKSLEVCERLSGLSKYDRVDTTARLYNNLGIIQAFQGRHQEGMEFINKAIAICKANDVYTSLHQAYTSLASILERRGEFHNSIKNLNFAIETAKKLKNQPSALCDSLLSKANILLKLGTIQAAKKSLQKAHKLKLCDKLRKEVEEKLKAVVILYRTEKELVSKACTDSELQKYNEKMGDGFCKLNCYDKAIEYYLKMLEVAERTNNNLSACYYSLAATYRDDEQFDKAIEYYEKEYKLSDFKKGLDTLCEIADTKESSGCSSSEVILCYERALNSCKRENNQREEGRMLVRLLDYLRRTGNSDRIPEYEKRFNETGFVPSDSEESAQNANSEDDVSLDNLTDYSDESDSASPTGKRRSKTFQVRRNLRGETQLHSACIAGKTNIVKHLLEQGHPVNIRDNSGWLPLHDACISGHLEIVKLLLDKGATINDRGGTHCDGITPLHDAAVNGHLEVMELLLDRGASVLAKTDGGETAFHYLKKASLEGDFDQEKKRKCQEILDRMSVVLDKAGQSKEINISIKNGAFVSNQSCEFAESNKRRMRVARRLSSEDEENRLEQSNSNIRNLRTRSISEEYIDSHMKNVRESAVLPKTQATNEYKMVMDNLRKKPCDVPTTSSVENDNSKRSAFVMTNEMADDWLEDDLGEMRAHKKRKISGADRLINTSGTRNERILSDQSLRRHNSLETMSSKSSTSSRKSKNKSPLKRNRRSNSNETISTNKSDRQDNMEDVENFTGPNISDHIFIEYDSGDDLVVPAEDLRSKQQSSLLNAGFSRCTTPSDSFGRRNRTSQKKSLQPKITHYGSSTPISSSQNRLSSSPQKRNHIISPVQSILIDDDPMLAMDVNIEGRPFRVTSRMSLKNTLTVKWLALEAARRYAKKEYVEPVLELTTKSGAELVDDDPIETLFIIDNQVVEVNAKVLKWNLPPVRERYTEACTDMGTKPLEAVCQKLDSMTIALDMKDNGFLPKSIAPVCKALLRENRLLELDLSNNFLSLDCIRLLAASLPTLENLTKLNLACTNLHAEEIRFFSNMFSNSAMGILTKLSSLDLSQNFIMDESLQDIATITKHLNLRELNISLLSFTEDVFKQSYNRNANLVLNNIEVLNLSDNNLGNDAIVKFLSFVNPNHLTNLDVSNNKTSSGFLTSLIDSLSRDGAGLNLEYLDLSRCSVEDSEVFTLLRSSVNLQTLKLSYTQITSLSLRRLLESPIVKTIHLLGCDNINKYFDDSDSLWTLVDHGSKPKSLKISCDIKKFHILIKLWEEKYCDKAVIHKDEDLLILN